MTVTQSKVEFFLSYVNGGLDFFLIITYRQTPSPF